MQNLSQRLGEAPTPAWTLNPLHSFTGGSDGSHPLARVIFGPNGTLYGTTILGGNGGDHGTVFNLRPSPTACRTSLCPWTETVLYAFAGDTDGAEPEDGDLLFDRAGNIYGTTSAGGGSNYGTVYELTPSGSGRTESILYGFSGGYAAPPYIIKNIYLEFTIAIAENRLGP